MGYFSQHIPMSTNNITRWIPAAVCRKLDIVDNILNKLEKHAENLETLVSKRTAELENEKQKTDMLLYRMLPALVLILCIAIKIMMRRGIFAPCGILTSKSDHDHSMHLFSQNRTRHIITNLHSSIRN